MANPTAPLGLDKATGTGTTLAITPQSANGKMLIIASFAGSTFRPAIPNLTLSNGAAVHFIGFVGGIPLPDQPIASGYGGLTTVAWYSDGPHTSGVAVTVSGLNGGGGATITGSTRSTEIIMVYGAPAGPPALVSYKLDDALRKVSTVGASFGGVTIDLLEANDLLITAIGLDFVTTTATVTPSLGTNIDTTAATANGGTRITQCTGTYTAAGAVSAQAVTWTTSVQTSMATCMLLLFRGDTYLGIDKITLNPPGRPFYWTNETDIPFSGTYDETAGTVFTSLDYQLTDPISGSVITAWTNITVGGGLNINTVAKTWDFDLPNPGRGTYLRQVRGKNAGGTTFATSTIDWRPAGVGPNNAIIGSSTGERFGVSGPLKLPYARYRMWKWEAAYTGANDDKFTEQLGNGIQGLMTRAVHDFDDFYGDQRTPVCVIRTAESSTNIPYWSSALSAGVINTDTAYALFGGFDDLTSGGTGTNDIRGVGNGWATQQDMQDAFDPMFAFWQARWPGARIGFVEAQQAPLETNTAPVSAYENWTWINNVFHDTVAAAPTDFYMAAEARWSPLDGDNIHLSYTEGYPYVGQLAGANWAAKVTGDSSYGRQGAMMQSVASEGGGTWLATFDQPISTLARSLTGVTGFVIGTDATLATRLSPADYSAEVVTENQARLTPDTSFAGYTHVTYGGGSTPAMTNPLVTALTTTDTLFTDQVVAYQATFYNGTSATGPLSISVASMQMVDGASPAANDIFLGVFQQNVDASPTAPGSPIWTAGTSDILNGATSTASTGASNNGGTRGLYAFRKRLKTADTSATWTINGLSTTAQGNTQVKLFCGALIRGSFQVTDVKRAGTSGATITLPGFTKSTGGPRSFFAIVHGWNDIGTISPPDSTWDEVMPGTLIGTAGKEWKVAMFIKKNVRDYVNGTDILFTGLSGANIKSVCLWDLSLS